MMASLEKTEAQAVSTTDKCDTAPSGVCSLAIYFTAPVNHSVVSNSG